MGFSTISKYPVNKQELLKSIEQVCLNRGIKFKIKNNLDEEERTEIYVENRYSNDSEFPNYFYMDILPIKEQKELIETNPNSFKIREESYYMLTGTDQTDYDHLIYDFSLEYLRQNPEHYITLYDETFFSLEDMEKLEAKGGYYKDWCY